MTKENYINAINEFNAIKSFNIILPTKEDYYEKLIPYTNDIVDLKHQLIDLVRMTEFGLQDKKVSSKICLFVVHINQVSNGIRETMGIENIV